MLTDDDLERLVEQSGILFIYAATVVRYIEEDNFSRSAKRLKLVLATSPTSERGSDHMIGTLYTGILVAAFDDARDRSDRDEMKDVLHTIMCAQEPLAIDVVAGLLGLDSLSVQASLRPLRSVLHLSESSGVVTTLHKSFPDYMFDKTRSQNFCCDAQTHNALLAAGCFNLIRAPNPPFNICDLESSYLFDKDVPNIADRIEGAISKEMFYACQHWSAHLRLTDASSYLLDALHEFLSVRFLLWMEVMNLKESISAGVEALKRMLAWLQVGSSSENLRELARDAWMFTSAFSKSNMSHSTPHIYVSALPFWPDHTPISKYYVSKMQGLIRITGTAAGRQTSEPSPGHTADVTSVGYSHDRTSIVSGSTDKTIRIWDADTGQLVGEPLEGHTGSITSVGYSHDGTRIVSGSSDTTIRIWDAEIGRMVGEPLHGHTDHVLSAGFSHDDTHVVSGSWDKTIRIWDTHTGQMVGGPLRGHTGAIYSVAYSHDSKRVVSGSTDSTIRIWDPKTSQTVGEPLVGHTGRVFSVAYSQDSTRIVSGSSDNTIRIWDAQTGQMVGEPLKGHTDAVLSVEFSHDGRHIISGSHDNTLRVWDIETGQMVCESLQGHTDLVYSVGVLHDGTRIVSGSGDNAIRIWDTRNDPIVDVALDPRSTSRKAVNQIAYLSQLALDVHLPSSSMSSDHTTTSSHVDWTTDGDGWVLDQSMLLIWVPLELHSCLLRPRNLVVISAKGWLALDFSNAQLGENWRYCYRAEPTLSIR